MSEDRRTDPSGDELLDKLNELLNRHRQDPKRADSTAVPTLTESFAQAGAEEAGPGEAEPVPDEDDVPTLTEAVKGPGRKRGTPVSGAALDRIVAARLCAALEREIARLDTEHPEEQERLQRVRDTLARVLPDLLRHARRLSERDGAPPQRGKAGHDEPR
ncbi:MAG: hypothetical protein WDZ63_14905 [Burkholderiales bacterium]